MIKYTHIIWDWNGTLLDDFSASLGSVNEMLAARGMELMDSARYKECISVPISGFYEKAFDLSKEDYPSLLREYNSGYLRLLDFCGLSEGSVEMLDFFASEGCSQVIVSSSNNDLLVKNCKRYCVFERFDAILGAADFAAGSKIERAENYLKNADAEQGKVLVIGDLEHDAQLAKELGADCFLLTSGHEHPDRLARSGAVIIDKLTEIKTLI